MLKNAYDVSYLSVPRESKLESVTRFLQRLAGDDLLVPVAEIVSPDLGAPDLTFVKRGTAGVAVAMVHQWGSFAGFALRAAAYHRWLKECVCLSEAIIDRTIGVDTYIISHDIPSADSYLLKVLSDFAGLFFIRYQILEIEEQQKPVVRFHLLGVNRRSEEESDENRSIEANMASEKAAGRDLSAYELSSNEIDEFNVLKERYL